MAVSISFFLLVFDHEREVIFHEVKVKIYCVLLLLRFFTQLKYLNNFIRALNLLVIAAIKVSGDLMLT